VPKTLRQHSRLYNAVITSKITPEVPRHLSDCRTPFRALRQSFRVGNTVTDPSALLLSRGHRSEFYNTVMIVKMPICSLGQRRKAEITDV